MDKDLFQHKLKLFLNKSINKRINTKILILNKKFNLLMLQLRTQLSIEQL